MILRKPRAVNASQLHAAKANRVAKDAKRGVRGYHRFRSGMLNVAPKADERVLVEQNRKSLLLSLPPEIRNSIWTHAFQGTKVQVYCVNYIKYKLRLKPSEHDNAMSLLQTCRQIYYETALLPYKLSTFTICAHGELAVLSKRLKPYQYAQITSLEIAIIYDQNLSASHFVRLWGSHEAGTHFLKLSALKTIDIYVLEYEEEGSQIFFANIKSGLVNNLQRRLPYTTVSVTTSGLAWWDYIKQWLKKPRQDSR